MNSKLSFCTKCNFRSAAICERAGKELSALRSKLSTAEDGAADGAARSARAEAQLASREAQLSEARERGVEHEAQYEKTLESREKAHAEEANTVKRTLEARLELTERQPAGS